MRIQAQVIRNHRQRYNTAGDWQINSRGFLLVKVSHMWSPRMGWRAEMCLAVHEICEALLCHAHGVSQEKVDAFDMNYDVMKETCEPGDHHDCPYKKEHAIATAIERIMAAELGLNWSTYERELLKLSESYERKKRVPIQYDEPTPNSPDSTAESEEIPEENQ